MQDHADIPQERLTAYALNELDSAERAAIEAQLKNDPAAQRFVEDVRSTAEMLELELKQERLADLALPAVVTTAPIKAPAAPIAPQRQRFAVFAASAAALLLFGILLWNRAEKPREDSMMAVNPRPVAANREYAPGGEAKQASEKDGFQITDAIPAVDPLKYDVSQSKGTDPKASSKETTVGESVVVSGVAIVNGSPTTAPEPKVDVAPGLPRNNGLKSDAAKIMGPHTPSDQSYTKATKPMIRGESSPVQLPPADANAPQHVSTKPGAQDSKHGNPDAEITFIPNDIVGGRSTHENRPAIPPKTEVAAAEKEKSMSGIVHADAKKTRIDVDDLPTKLPTQGAVQVVQDDITAQGTTTPVRQVPKSGVDKKLGLEAPKAEWEKMTQRIAELDANLKLLPPSAAAINADLTAGYYAAIGPLPTSEILHKKLPDPAGAGKNENRNAVEFFMDRDELVLLQATCTANWMAQDPLNMPSRYGLFAKGSDDPTKNPRDRNEFQTQQNYLGTTVEPPAAPNGETYVRYPENNFELVRSAPLSTFSADVDTASFANVRRFLNGSQLPPPDAVRVEELVNYFKYNYDTVKLDDPFGVNVEAAACPWNAAHRLVRVAVKARDLVENKRPASNLVFLIDVSGSMDEANRLPLVKEGLKALVRRLGETDRVAIVTYAGESGIALPSTNCSDKERIIAAIDALRAAGGTNGGAGIQTAYTTAKQNFIKGGVNRVVLATDGDFNVGVTDPNELVRMIEAQSATGVFLTALGYGMGNIKDATLQRLADKGNGHYAYIDTAEESRKVLLEQMNATLVAVAKDVKFQVEFNPAQAHAYHLIGYEKRALAAQDFNNDAKDAGEIGAGHTVTAFYEVAPMNAAPAAGVDALKYQAPQPEPVVPAVKPANASTEMLTLKIRYKLPDGDASKRLEFAFTDKGASFEQASADFKFGSAVALFGQILRRSQYTQGVTMRRAVELADDSRGADEGGYRREFIQLARKAAELRGER